MTFYYPIFWLNPFVSSQFLAVSIRSFRFFSVFWA